MPKRKGSSVSAKSKKLKATSLQTTEKPKKNITTTIPEEDSDVTPSSINDNVENHSNGTNTRTTSQIGVTESGDAIACNQFYCKTTTEENSKALNVNSDFSSGSFIFLKSDLSDGKQDPPLWRIDGKALRRKYIPTVQDGKTLYKSISVYMGWTINNKDLFLPIKVRTKQETRKEHIVEIKENQFKFTVQELSASTQQAPAQISQSNNNNPTTSVTTGTTATPSMTAGVNRSLQTSGTGSTSSVPPLKAVIEALKRLKVYKNPSTSNLITKADFFCVEDSFMTVNLRVTMQQFGDLKFPLCVNQVFNMVEAGNHTSQHPQIIPSSKLKILLDKGAVASALVRIGIGLNMDDSSSLALKLDSMMINGPGQFCKMKGSSEMMENAVGTLVMVLPSFHEGGELIVKHGKKSHVFFGSSNHSIIKCIAFYADCDHEIKMVESGYRVALIYTLLLQSGSVPQQRNVDEQLNEAVKRFFSEGKRKLVYSLMSSYSKHNLNWGSLTASDSTRAAALFAVAKKQGRVPCLALAEYHECYDLDYFSHTPTLMDSDTKLYFWIDENNLEFKNGTENVSSSEICFTKETKTLFEPFKTEQEDDNSEDKWYRRACVVLWSNQFVSFHTAKHKLNNLHKLTAVKGNREVLLEKMKGVGQYFIQFRHKPKVCDMLLDIVIYLEQGNHAVSILSKLSDYLLQANKIPLIVQLEHLFGEKVWTAIIDRWKKSTQCYGLISNVDQSITFIQKYFEYVSYPTKSVIIDEILGGAMKTFIKHSNSRKVDYVYGRVSEGTIETVCKLLKFCVDLGNTTLESNMIHSLTSSPSAFPTVSLGQLYFRLQAMFRPDQITAPYMSLRESTEKAIISQLSELGNEEDWSLDHPNACTCVHCLPVKAFFNSKTSTNLVFTVAKTNKAHIEKHFHVSMKEHLKDLYEISSKVDRLLLSSFGKKFKVEIKKLPKLIEDRQRLINELIGYRDIFQDSKTGKCFEFIAIGEVKLEEILPQMDPLVEVKKTEPVDDCTKNEEFVEMDDELEIKTELIIKTEPF